MLEVEIWKYLPDDIWLIVKKWNRKYRYLEFKRLITLNLKFPESNEKNRSSYKRTSKIFIKDDYELRWDINNYWKYFRIFKKGKRIAFFEKSLLLD